MPDRAREGILAGTWAMLPEWLTLVLEIAGREHTPLGGPELAELRARYGRDDGERADGGYRLYGRTASIAIYGPIVPRASLFGEISGATSVAGIDRQLRAALDDRSVAGILLDVDSPGGEITGIRDLAALIRETSAEKPVVGFARGLAASAGYYLIAACEEIVVSPTAMLGSIGVYACYRDYRERDAKAGIREIEFLSSQSPRKRPDPGTDAGRAQIQALLDDVAEVFVADVARFRGVTREQVLEEFGAGGMFVGQKAVAAGLADRTGTFDDALERLAGRVQAREEASRRPAGSAGAAEAAHDAREGKEQHMGLWSDIRAVLTRNGVPPDEEAKETTQEAAAGNGAASAAQQPPAQPAQPATDPVTAARLQALEAQLAASQRRERETLAAGFAAEMVQGRHAFPAEADVLRTAMLQALEDDTAHPLPEGSRAQQLRAQISARPAHVLTQELLPAGMPEGVVVLRPAAEGSGKELAEEERKKLLGMTPLGQAVLAASRNGTQGGTR